MRTLASFCIYIFFHNSIDAVCLTEYLEIVGSAFIPTPLPSGAPFELSFWLLWVTRMHGVKTKQACVTISPFLSMLHDYLVFLIYIELVDSMNSHHYYAR